MPVIAEEDDQLLLGEHEDERDCDFYDTSCDDTEEVILPSQEQLHFAVPEEPEELVQVLLHQQAPQHLEIKLGSGIRIDIKGRLVRFSYRLQEKALRLA